MLDDPHSYLTTAGRAVGISFVQERTIFPTLTAHTLVEGLKEMDEANNNNNNQGANQFMEELYKRYFERAENINDVDHLADTAVALGVLDDPESAKAIMKDHTRRKKVQEKDQYYKNVWGVSGVPYYVIQRNDGQADMEFSGAQPIDRIAEQLLEAAAEKK